MDSKPVQIRRYQNRIHIYCTWWTQSSHCRKMGLLSFVSVLPKPWPHLSAILWPKSSHSFSTKTWKPSSVLQKRIMWQTLTRGQRKHFEFFDLAFVRDKEHTAQRVQSQQHKNLCTHKLCRMNENASRANRLFWQFTCSKGPGAAGQETRAENKKSRTISEPVRIMHVGQVESTLWAITKVRQSCFISSQ